MSEYENPQIPEGINLSKENPLLDFVQMLLIVGVSLAALVSLLVLLSSYLVGYIPLSVEQRVADNLASIMPVEQVLDEQATKQRDYIQQLAEVLSQDMDLPQAMRVKVHLQTGDTINAFATLGGNLVFYQGLVDKLHSENALAFVVAHELAHLKLRHPMLALGRGIVVGATLTTLLGLSDSSVSQLIVNASGQLTLFSFNRDMETQADELAIQALLTRYGHLAGADELFLLLEKEQQLPAWVSTHPSSTARLQRMVVLPGAGELSPLPVAFIHGSIVYEP
jgi:Zn-dependent protease with chaperone function